MVLKQTSDNQDTLIVMYEENRSAPQNTWSGTSYQLRIALEKYFCVEFVNLYDGKILRTLKRLTWNVGKKRKSILFGPLYEKMLALKANYLLRKYKGIPVLEISKDVRIRKPYYIYQDLTVEYTNEIRGKISDDIIGGLKLFLSKDEVDRMSAVQRRLYENVEHAFFMGHWICDYMKQAHPLLKERFSAVGGGLSSEFFVDPPITIDEKERSILFNGIDFTRKGGPLVLKAFKAALKKGCNAKLVIVGPELEIDDENIVCLGRVPREELSRIMRKASLMCLPSRFEAYGLAFPEALCFGIPCIGRDKYEMPYFIEDGKNGYLLKKDDPDDLAELMIKALNNSEMLRYTIENSGNELAKYTWDAVASRIHQIISNAS